AGVLGNLATIGALTPVSMATEASLAPPARAQLLTVYSPQAWYGAGQFFAPNPDFGAAIDYYLRQGGLAGAPTVTITVSDATGVLMRTIAGTAARGVNRVRWDLRMDPPLSAPDAGGSPAGAEPIAPAVLPGKYVVSVRLPSGRSVKAPIVVE